MRALTSIPTVCFLALVFVAQLLFASAQFSCRCKCCSGSNLCTPVYVGSTPVASCQVQCVPDICYTAFPMNCTHLGGSAVGTDGCVDPSIPSYDSCAVKPELSAPWTGSYLIQTTGSVVCDPNVCGCCMDQKFDISQNGVQLVVTGSLKGSCSGSFSVTSSVPKAYSNTSSTVATSLGGRSVSLTLTKDLCSTKVAVTYKNAPSCNIVASRFTSSAFPSSSAPSVWLTSLLSVLLGITILSCDASPARTQ